MKRLIWLVMLCGLIGGTQLGVGRSQNDALVPEDWQPAAPDHVVREGDTLWDLSEQYTGSAWNWPRLWAMNPEINNPHWIYPGDIVRFYPADYDGILASRSFEEPEPYEEDYDDTAEDEDDAVRSVPAVLPVAVAPLEISSLKWRRYGGLFLTEEELEEAGVLVNAAEDRFLLIPGDMVFLQTKSRPSPGTRYSTFRKLSTVMHPLTKEPFGLMTQVTGTATVIDVDEDGLVRARIDSAIVEVERGQFVRPFEEEPLVTIEPATGPTDVGGIVVAIQFDAGVVAGQEQLVFIDKGTNEGLARGHWIDVFSDAVASPQQLKAVGKPQLNGKLIVLQAKPDASTCLVVKVKHEVEVGDAFRVASGSGA